MNSGSVEEERYANLHGKKESRRYEKSTQANLSFTRGMSVGKRPQEQRVRSVSQKGNKLIYDQQERRKQIY